MSGAAGLVWLLAAEVGDLSLPYGESSRPRLCEVGDVAPPDAPTAAGGAWERVRREPYQALCLGLARAQIRLEREPALALERARELARRWPDRPEPKLLEARAALRTGDAAASWAAWQVVRTLAGGPAAPLGPELASAPALRDFALAAVATGQAEAATSTYRRLVSWADAWPDPRHVQRLHLEAAAASLRGTPPRFDEAAGYVAGALGGARSTGLAAYAVGLEAWIAARRGVGAAPPRRLTEAEIRHFVALVRAPGQPSFWPALPRHEAYAVASLLVEKLSVIEALELWGEYQRGLATAAADAGAQQFARERQARLAAAGRAP